MMSMNCQTTTTTTTNNNMDNQIRAAKVRAIHLSNQGASSFLMKNYNSARKHFVEAMEICREGMKIPASDDENSMDYETSSTTQCHFLSTTTSQTASHPTSSGEACGMFPESQQQQHHGEGYIHTNPIHLPLQSDLSLLPSFSSLSGIIIFNQALTLHLGALRALKDESSKSLSPSASSLQGRDELLRALHMYEVGYALLEEEIDPNPRLVLAIINNLSQGYNTMGEIELAEKYLEDLLSILMMYISRSDFMNHGLDCFLVHAVPRSMISSAAAA